MSDDASQAAARAPRRAGLLSAAALLYASACGGPYGTEDFVARSGPGLLIVLQILAAGLWGIPLALATAELSARRPIEGGYYRWVREYMGEYWGFQAGTWSLMSSFLDNALYPALFAGVLPYFVPGLGAFERWLAAAGFIAVLTWLNIRGIRIVGGAAVALNLFLAAPIVWIVIAAIPRWQFNPFVPFGAGERGFEGFGAGLALAIWFHSGYSDISTAAEEIDNPRRTIPYVLLLVTPLVILSYVLPMVAGLAAVGGWEGWESGQFAAVGQALGGSVLGTWAFLGSVASFVVIFMSYLLWWSRLAWAFAADGFLPRWLVHRHPVHGTPHRVLVLYAAIYAALAAIPFKDLLIVDVWLFGAYDLLVMLAVVRARRVPETGDTEGFRIPGGTFGVGLSAALIGVTWIAVLIATARQNQLDATAGAVALAIGFAAYPIARRLRRRADSPTG
ncbi:MAG TPA: APC family permease [Patescibacteria group bacterium]|nr:APC family permease [Patescibacteria group bacterium]